MTPIATHAAIRSELEELLREREIDRETFRVLSDLYPVTRWDWRSLGRWFLIFGALSVAAGSAIFLRDIFHFTYEKLAVLLTVATLALFAGGQWLKMRRWSMTGQVAELIAAFTLIGLSFTLGIIYSTGSGDWPSLVLIDLIIILPASYALNNRLLLVLAAVLFFTWFGGRTGYISGWGAYWFGMNYPLRFIVAAVVIIVLGSGHMALEKTVFSRFRGYAKIWLSSGVFFLEMALWLLSLFGNYQLIDGPWRLAPASELFLFNSLWTLTNVVLIVAGTRMAFRMLTAYGATFLIIQGYTLFFAHAADRLGYTTSSFLAGGMALVLAFVLETQRRQRIAGADEHGGKPGDA